MHHVIFRCRLCRGLGRVVALVAELDPEPHLVTVVDLLGCEHADGFGYLDKLALEQEWELIEAALGSPGLEGFEYWGRARMEGLHIPLLIDRATKMHANGSKPFVLQQPRSDRVPERRYNFANFESH